MNHLLVIIIGILVLTLGVVLADREFIDDIRDQRVIALEERLQAKNPKLKKKSRKLSWLAILLSIQCRRHPNKTG